MNKALLAGVAIAALFVGSASAEWRAYQNINKSAGLDSASVYSTGSTYGISTTGAGWTQQLVTVWNDVPVTNPVYSFVTRGTDNKPVVTFDKKKGTEVDNWILIANVVDGKMIRETNAVTPGTPAFSYYQNGHVYWTNNVGGPSTGAATHIWINYGSTATTKKFGATNAVKKTKINWYRVYTSDSGLPGNQIVQGAGYENLPSDTGSVNKKPKVGFPKGFNDANVGMGFNIDWDYYTNSSAIFQVATGVGFGSSSSTRYDASLSKALASATTLADAINLAKAYLAGKKYVPLSEIAYVDAIVYGEYWQWLNYKNTWLNAYKADRTQYLVNVGGVSYVVDEMDPNNNWW